MLFRKGMGRKALERENPLRRNSTNPEQTASRQPDTQTNRKTKINQ